MCKTLNRNILAPIIGMSRLFISLSRALSRFSQHDGRKTYTILCSTEEKIQIALINFKKAPASARMDYFRKTLPEDLQTLREGGKRDSMTTCGRHNYRQNPLGTL